MLRTILLEILEQKSADEHCDKVLRDIKDIAKELFFKKKLNDLVDYIFEIKEINTAEIEQFFVDKINYLPCDTKEFLLVLKDSITSNMAEKMLPKNRDGLLELLNYSHLKPFLTMFKG